VLFLWNASFAGRLREPPTACQEEGTREGERLAVRKALALGSALSGFTGLAVASRPALTRAAAARSSGPDPSGRLAGQSSCREEQSQFWAGVQSKRPCAFQRLMVFCGHARPERSGACTALSGLAPRSKTSSGRTPLYLIKYRIALQYPCD